MKSERRKFLYQFATAGGAVLLGTQAVSAAGLQSPGFIAQENGYLKSIAPLVFMSLATSTLAAKKANEQLVKKFATFELAETKAMTTVMEQMGIPAPQMPAHGEAVLKDLQAQTGKPFDLKYISAQAETHGQLRSITERFIATKPKANDHQAHLAMLSLATITEHLELCKMLLNHAAK